MRHIQIGVTVIQYDEALFNTKPLLDRNGFLYKREIIRKADSTIICEIYGDSITWHAFPIDSRINQRKGLTVMEIV